MKRASNLAILHRDKSIFVTSRYPPSSLSGYSSQSLQPILLNYKNAAETIADSDESSLYSSLSSIKSIAQTLKTKNKELIHELF